MKSLQYFKSLSDITRVRLFNVLLHHELSVGEIVALMDMGQSRISRHLKILTDAGLLACRRDGVWAFYSAVSEGDGKEFIEAVGYLFDDDPVFTKDLMFAGKVVEERKQETRLFFDAIAPEWDRLKLDILGDFDLNRAVAEMLGNCGAVADLGCGTGELLTRLMEQAGSVIGVDSSSSMLQQARNRFSGGGVDLRLGELEHLPLSDGEVDCAVISLALHHMDDPAAAFAEAARVLAPGGTFLIAELDKHGNEAMRRTYGDRWLGFTPLEMEKFFGDHGFSLETSASHRLLQSLSLTLYRGVKKG